MKKKELAITPNEVIKRLEKITESGQNRSTIFDDFLELALASLEALPRHIESATKNGTFAKDTPETVKLFAKLKEKYGREDEKKAQYYFGLFGEAMAMLIEIADENIKASEYRDLLGDVYMSWEIGSTAAGQFFTPWEVCSVMAKMTMGDIEKEVHERIKKALCHPDNIWGQSVLLTSMLINGPDESYNYFLEKVIPAAAPYYDPITVMDPCVGSGSMLLASASVAPRWAVQYGLIQFYGCDIDFTCVKMCKVNVLLYGLNGSFIKSALALSQSELKMLPDPYADAYRAAQEEPERAIEITQEIKVLGQMRLFV